MTTRPSNPSAPSDARLEDLLRAGPPIERAPAWLRASTMDRIARAHRASRATHASSEPSRGGAIWWRLAPLAGLAAVLVIGAIVIPERPKPSTGPVVAGPAIDVPVTTPLDGAGAPQLADTGTAEAFRTLRALARRPELQPAALVYAQMETPLLREAKLVMQDGENVARAVLARLPVPSALP